MKTILALVLVNSLFGIGYPLVKTIVHYLTPAQWVFVRVLSSSLILLVFQGKALFSHPITLKQFGGLVLAAFLGITLNQICFVEGLYRSTSGHAAIINATIPLQTILLAWLFGKEKIQPLECLGIACGLVGVGILLQVQNIGVFNPFLKGDLFVLINATSYSLFLIFAKQTLESFSPILALTWISLLSVVGTGWYAGWSLPLSTILHLPPKLWLYMLYLITFQSIVTYYANIWALKRVEASHAAIFVYLQPVIATILAYTMLGDLPQGHFYLSAGLIFVGIVLGSL